MVNFTNWLGYGVQLFGQNITLDVHRGMKYPHEGIFDDGEYLQ